MQEAVTAILIILTVASMCTLGYWSFAIARIRRTMRRVPSLAAGLQDAGAGAPSAQVCVIVPAHDEEESIAVVARSLLEQDYVSLRLVFALDRCRDRTAEVLREVLGTDPRCEIIPIDSCDDGWVGKVHALKYAFDRSAAAASADILLFVDADTSLDPACVRAAVNLLEVRGLDMLSALSTLTSDRWFERVVQPAAGVELLRQFPLLRANDPQKRRPFANGQFIMIRRATYEAIGGHAAVKSEVLEDVWLARRINEAGFGTGFFLSGGMLRCRMYSRWDDFRRGWLRIYGESASRKPQRLRGAARWLRTLGTFLPLSSLACVIAAGVTLRQGGVVPWLALWMGSAAVCVFLGAVGIIYRLARTPIWAAPTYVLGAWMVGGLLIRAARVYERNEPTIWGGRQYVRAAK
jgi:chlorobactene glucosyltransferase